MKALLAARCVEAPKTHKLQELFLLLPTEDASAVRASYGANVGSPSLDELLAQIGEYFVRLRYEYENPVFSYSESPVAAFSKALYIHTSKSLGIKVGFDRINV